MLRFIIKRTKINLKKNKKIKNINKNKTNENK